MHRKPGLDLLRALAVIWVTWYHSKWAGYYGGGALRWSGWMGVDLFFALSGFLIGSQIFKRLEAGQGLGFQDFYLKRFFRTLPAYFVVLAIYLAWPSLREIPNMGQAWRFFTFTMNFGMPLKSAFSQVWSLCVEEQFYLVFPLLAVFCFQPLHTKRSLTIIAVLVLGGMALRAGVWAQFVEPVRVAGGDVEGAYRRYIYYPTYARLDPLLAGILVAAARCYHWRLWRWVQEHPNLLAAFGLGVIGVSITVLYWDHIIRLGTWASILGYPVVALAMASLVAAAAASEGLLAKLQVPGMAWVAKISYSLYLSQKLVYYALHGRFSYLVDNHGLVSALIYAVAIAAAGAALYYGVEHPFLLLRDRVLAWRRNAAKGAAASSS